MTAQIAIYGRLGGDPDERTSASGKVWTTASVAVSASRDPEDSPLWLKVVAFGAAAETLARHSKGDQISAIGRLQVNRWTDREGRAREDLQVIAEQVISARTVRPSGDKRRGDDPARQAPASRMAQSDTALDDQIPF